MPVAQRIYNWVGKKGNKRLVIKYDTKDNALTYIDTIGDMWVDHKYSILKNALRYDREIITDSDLIAFDDYIELLKTYKIRVHLVANASSGSASKSRLRNALGRLKAAGIKVKYYASVDSLNKQLK
jgi:hypothetical protein